MNVADYIRKIGAALSRWLQLKSDDTGIFFVAVVAMGVLCGAAAALLKHCIDSVMHFIFSDLNIHAGNWAFLLLPVAGMFIAMAFSKYVVHDPMDHASERIKVYLAKGVNKLNPRIILGSIVSCAFTLGTGGSAGAESPIAYSGAAIGSNLGRVLKMDDNDISVMLGCGAAAGIAGIYMAPIGGVMFAFEILRMRQSLTSALALTCSCLAASLTCYLLMGCHTDVTFMPEMRFDNSLIPYVLACGVMCGVYSVYYFRVLDWCRSKLGRISRSWMRAISGGALLAVMLFFFPSLYGEGYGIIGKLMADEGTSIVAYSPLYSLADHTGLLLLFFVILLLLKPIGTSATNDSGGVGGDFTPTLFCGGVAGFMFALVLNHYFHCQLPYALFAFFGMSAIMSGAKQAPLMAIFITAEMTGLYGFIMPLTIAALLSFVTSYFLNRMLPGGRKEPPAPAAAPATPTVPASGQD